MIESLFSELLNWIHNWGTMGLYVAMFIEGSALPFFGTINLIMYGMITENSIIIIFFISIGISIAYTLASFIPYYIGYRIESGAGRWFSKNNQNKIANVKQLFNKYGIWTIAVASPLPIGNVVPFLAGMSRMSIWKYAMLTLLGIFPSSFGIMLLGYLWNGDIDSILSSFNQAQNFLLIGFTALALLYMMYRSKVNKKIKVLQ